MTNEEFVADVDDELRIYEVDYAKCVDCIYAKVSSLESDSNGICVRWPHTLFYTEESSCPEFKPLQGQYACVHSALPRLEQMVHELNKLLLAHGIFDSTMIALIEFMSPFDLPEDEYFWYFSPLENAANKVGLTMVGIDYHTDNVGFFAYRISFDLLETKNQEN